MRGNVFTDVGSSALTLSGISAADHHPATPAQQSVGNRIAANLISGVGRGYPDAPGIYIGFSSGNSWLQPPMKSEMELANLGYALVSEGKLIPYSPEGFFNVCPHTSGGVSYPTNLSYSGNAIHPADP